MSCSHPRQVMNKTNPSQPRQEDTTSGEARTGFHLIMNITSLHLMPTPMSISIPYHIQKPVSLPTQTLIPFDDPTPTAKNNTTSWDSSTTNPSPTRPYPTPQHHPITDHGICLNLTNCPSLKPCPLPPVTQPTVCLHVRVVMIHCPPTHNSNKLTDTHLNANSPPQRK